MESVLQDLFHFKVIVDIKGGTCYDSVSDSVVLSRDQKTHSPPKEMARIFSWVISPATFVGKSLYVDSLSLWWELRLRLLTQCTQSPCFQLKISPLQLTVSFWRHWFLTFLVLVPYSDGNKKACTSLPFPCLALFGSITDIAVVKQNTGNFLQPNFLNRVWWLATIQTKQITKIS